MYCIFFNIIITRNVVIGQGCPYKVTLDTKFIFDPPSVAFTLSFGKSKYPDAQVPG